MHILNLATFLVVRWQRFHKDSIYDHMIRFKQFSKTGVHKAALGLYRMIFIYTLIDQVKNSLSV